MTFSQKVKQELIKNEYENSCCERAFLYGICLFAKRFSSTQITLQSETKEIIELSRKLLRKQCNVACKVDASPNGRSYSIKINNPADCTRIMRVFSHEDGGSLKINFANFTCDECAKAFLAGVFLACGTVSSPEKDYHMEFSVAYLNLSKSLVTLFREEDLTPKTTSRKGYNIIYFKDSEAIEACLYKMGASDAMFEMMNIEIVKDFRNKANRTANCETANIGRTVNASYAHIAAIEKIRDEKGLDFLKEDLRLMAQLRLENPDASLSELAKLSGLSRSGVNHRLNRILQISKEL